MQAVCGFSKPLVALQHAVTPRPACSSRSAAAPLFRKSASSGAPGMVHFQQRDQPSWVVKAAFATGAMESVGDVMTAGGIVTCSPQTSVDDALELLVEHRVSGLPVCDADGRVVGVVSDFDLLALEGVGQRERGEGLFPSASSDWNTYYEVQRLIQKNEGKIVADVMTPDPVTVRPATSLEEAANLLLRLKIRRLPVVDEQGRLKGVISRGNMIAAALRARKASKA